MQRIIELMTLHCNVRIRNKLINFRRTQIQVSNVAYVSTISARRSKSKKKTETSICSEVSLIRIVRIHSISYIVDMLLRILHVLEERFPPAFDGDTTSLNQ